MSKVTAKFMDAAMNLPKAVFMALIPLFMGAYLALAMGLGYLAAHAFGYSGHLADGVALSSGVAACAWLFFIAIDEEVKSRS